LYSTTAHVYAVYMIAWNAPSQAKETFIHTSYEILEILCKMQSKYIALKAIRTISSNQIYLYKNRSAMKKSE